MFREEFLATSLITVDAARSENGCIRLGINGNRLCASQHFLAEYNSVNIDTVRYKRPQAMLVSLIALLALCVSSVSACACTHHQPVAKKAESSCHAASHQETVAESAAELPAGPAFKTDCACFVRTQTPYVLGKTEAQKIKADKNISSTAVVRCAFERNDIALVAAEGVVDLEPAYHPEPSRLSAPSRAPPRL